MRIRFNYSKNLGDVPINNQSIINSYIHKCLGRNNEYHDAKSDYNVSSLQGGKLDAKNGVLNFENGGFIVVSSLDTVFMSKFLTGVMSNLELTAGMKFTGVEYINEEFYNGWNHFATLSPFIIKDYTSDGRTWFVTLNDENFQEKVKNYLIRKISKIDPTLNLSDFDVHIPKSDKHKTKRILVKNAFNIANQCHISIKCSAKVAELLYNIGIGQSSGSGFGTIYKTENRNMYKTRW